MSSKIDSNYSGPFENDVGLNGYLRGRKWTSYSLPRGQALNFYGHYAVMPKIEEMEIYRVQTEDYGTANSGICREEDPNKQTVFQAKMNWFVRMMEPVPITEDIGVSFPLKAVAQHYGLKTDMLSTKSMISKRPEVKEVII